MKENKINVAIIDSGIKEELVDINLLHNIEINNELLINLKPNNDEIIDNHGTLCAAIIKLYTSNVDISSVKILNNYKSNVNQLYVALEWCVQHDVKVINVSLGSYNFKDFDEMKKVVNYVHSKGIIMVCASQNGEFITYPASFSNVIGVKCDRENLLSKREYFFNTNFEDGIEITAFSKHILPGNLGMLRVCENSNSFATPMITAKVCNIISNMSKYSMEDIKNELRAGSKNYSSEGELYLLYRRPDWIRNALIFSPKKVINSKATYFFEVIEEIFISNDELCDIISKRLYGDNIVDTIIVISKLDLNYISKVINIAEHYRKNIVFIDDDIENIPKENISKLIKIWHGNLIWNEMKYLEDKIRTIDIPIVCIQFQEDIDELYFLCTLKKLFFMNGYNAFVSLEKSEAVLYDLEYIPEKYIENEYDKIKEYITMMTYKMNSDIIIHSFNFQEKLDKLYSQLDIDIEIFVQVQEVEICMLENKNEIYKLTSDKLDDELIEKVFRYIINTL